MAMFLPITPPVVAVVILLSKMITWLLCVNDINGNRNDTVHQELQLFKFENWRGNTITWVCYIVSLIYCSWHDVNEVLYFQVP